MLERMGWQHGDGLGKNNQGFQSLCYSVFGIIFVNISIFK